MPRRRSEESFEEALQALEEVVDSLEKGDLSLEQSLHLYERGVALSDRCQQALYDAEQKVRVLSERGQTAQLQPFEPAGER